MDFFCFSPINNNIIELVDIKGKNEVDLIKKREEKKNERVGFKDGAILMYVK